LRPMQGADDAPQLRFSDQLLRGQSPDRNHELWSKQLKFAVEMLSAIRNLDWTRHAVASAFRVASGKAADDSAHVNATSKVGLVNSELLEPAEETSARRVGKRPAIFHFVRAGCLADEHHLRARNGAGHRL